MSPIRFRIRTIMITVAVVALLMGFLRLPDEVRAGVELILFLAVIVGVFAEFVAFSAYLWPGTRPHGQRLRRIKYRPRMPRAEPERGARESSVMGTRSAELVIRDESAKSA
jgi:hypothetical protein